MRTKRRRTSPGTLQQDQTEKRRNGPQYSPAPIVGRFYWLDDETERVVHITQQSPLKGKVFQQRSELDPKWDPPASPSPMVEWVHVEDNDGAVKDADPRSPATPIVDMLEYANQRRSPWFTRSKFTTASGLEFDDETERCAICSSIIKLPPIYCSDCREYMHEDCIDGSKPMQISHRRQLLDSTGKPVECPVPGPERHKVQIDSDARAQDRHVSICIDVGSTAIKASLTLGETGADAIEQTPVAAIFLDKGKLYTNTTFRQMKDTLPESQRFGPLKLMLVEGNDSKLLQKFMDAFPNQGSKETVTKDIWKKILTDTLKTIAESRQDAIEKYLNQSPGGLQKPRVYLNLAIALPAGLQDCWKSPVLTALYESGKNFAELFPDLDKSEVLMFDLLEPEMAVREEIREEIRQDKSEQSEWALVFDVGGTTTDFCAMRRGCVYNASTTKICGTVSLLEDFISQTNHDPGCESQYDSIKKWLFDRFSDKVGLLPFVMKEDRVSLVDRLRATQIKQFEEYVLKSLRRTRKHIAEIYPTYSEEDFIDKVQIYGRGGGLFDDKMLAALRIAKEEVFPDTRLTLDRGFSLLSSPVLKGMQGYMEHYVKSKFESSPWTIVATADCDLDPNNQDTQHVLYVNKGDPLGPEPLLPPLRARAGEYLTWNVQHHGTEGTDIPVYALPEQVTVAPDRKDTPTSISDATLEQFRLKCVPMTTIQMKPESGNRFYMAVWPNVLGHTLRLKAYKDPVDNYFSTDDVCRLDGRPNDSILFETIHGLDLYKINQFKDESAKEPEFV